MKARNHLRTVSAQTRNDEGRTYKRSASKLACVCKWGPSGRLSEDDAETTTSHQSEGPWSNTAEAAVLVAVRMQSAIASCSDRRPKCAAERTKDRCKPALTKGMPGVWLNRAGYWEGAV
jgi:hypothetical protein